jgi:hypothetical protein
VKQKSLLQTSFWFEQFHSSFHKVTVLFVLGGNGVLVFGQVFFPPVLGCFKIQTSRKVTDLLTEFGEEYGSVWFEGQRWGILWCSQSTDTFSG